MTKPCSRHEPRHAASGVAGLALLGCLLASTGAWASDDRYRFSDGVGEVHAVELEPTGAGARLTWPASASGAWDTALLGVRVDASGVAAPRMLITAGASRVELHLDPGAHGLRWLNLSRLRQAIAETGAITLSGEGVSLASRDAELRLFANQLDLEGRILVLAPHPDDAEIAAFGLYANRNATVVTVTAGNAGDANYRRDVADPAEHYRFKGFLRAVDSVTVPWLGGIPPERTYNLGYFDARLRDMHQAPEATLPELYGPNTDVGVYRRANLGELLPKGARESSWANLVDDLEALLRRVDPALIVMPYPQLDHHADHQYTTVAAVEALERWSGSPRVLLYTNHAARDRYPFGPAGTAVSLPPWPHSELVVEGVYSHPVDAGTRRLKLYALEAMHDLRLSPAEQEACAVPGAGERRPDFPRNLETDYFRRGVRAEEIFFAFSREGAIGVVRSFLADFGDD